MEMSIQTKMIVAASSGTRAADNVFMIPIPHQPLYIQIQAGHCDESDAKSYPPSPLLWVPLSPAIRNNDRRTGALEYSDHVTLTVPEPQMDLTALTVPEPQVDHIAFTVSEPEKDHTVSTVPESQICRICAFDEEDDEDGGLVELGCSCKGELSRMHRNCILKWYGVRMLLEKIYKCELCDTVLHPKAQLIVARGVNDHESGDRAILMNALKSSLASYAPHIEVERAATYEELVQLLLDGRAEWYRHRRQVVVHIEAAAASSNSQEEPEEASETVSPACGRGAFIMSIGATVVSVGLYTYLLHFYGNAGYS